MKLTKCAAFSDIHWGGRSNAEMHNLDCLKYIEWFCNEVKKDPEIDHIVFLGDWYDNRSTINVATLNHSHNGATMINDLGLPVYLIIGNHDIYHRHTRDIYSTMKFANFKNFVLINTPQVRKEIGEGTFFTPFLFHHEYPSLIEYKGYKTWWGHFEFRGFVITGSDIKMPTGPNADDFGGPKFIFSGHFHKRQAYKNVVYIGNTFPTNFNDAGDHDRGMMVFDHKTDDVKFIDWKACPKFIKSKLSDILEDPYELLPNSRVKCEIDIPIDYEEGSYLKEKFCKKHKLREMILEESPSIRDSLIETKSEIDDTTLSSVNDMVLEMLGNIENKSIDNNMLIEIYRGLEID
jgi:DNA repair exonuclease SbcCD nuclease subunit